MFSYPFSRSFYAARAIALSAFVVCVSSFTGGLNAEPAGSPIQQRKAIFSQIGKATKEANAMAKGTAHFDIVKAQEIFRLYTNSAEKLADLFPENSQTGDKTEAAPAIWADKGKFNALLTQFAQDSRDAAGKTIDQGTFKGALREVLGDCKSCHDRFRIEGH